MKPAMLEHAASALSSAAPAEPSRNLARNWRNRDVSNSASRIVNGPPVSPGEPLDRVTLSFMEQRFAHDFSHVRIHTDTFARKSADEVDARAYTVGSDVVFGREQFAPNTDEGKHILAHELAHVVQQSRGGIAPPLEPGSSLEAAADAAADHAIASRGPVPIAGACGVGLARLPWKDVRKRVWPVAGLLAGSLGEKAVDKAIAQAEAITGADVPKPAEALVDRGLQTLDRMSPDPKQAPQAGSSTASGTTAQENPAREARKHSEGSSEGSFAPSATKRSVDPADDTPELNQFFRERWRKAQVFHGVKLMYVAERTLTRAATQDRVVNKSSRYWLVSHADKETGEVFYYAAFNRQANRSEYAIGPAELDTFLANEKYHANIAETIYPSGGGELKGWEARAGQATDMAMEGDWGGALGAVVDSNAGAWQDPEFIASNAANLGGIAATKPVPKPPSRMMRWLRPRAAGALSRVMVAVDNSLPVHTGGGSLANATALAAGEIRPQLLNTRPAIPTGAIASSAEAGVSTASKTTGQAPTTRVRASQALEGALKKEVTQTAETAVKKEATQTTKGVIKGDEDAAASTSTAMKDGEEEALKATPRNPAAKDLAAGSQVPKHSESASNPAVEPLQYVGALSNGNVANDVVPHREPQVMAATGTDSAAPITSEVVGTPSIAGVTDPMVASGSKMTPKTAEYLRVNRIANQAGYFVREAKPSKADLKAIAAYYRKPTPQLGGTAGHAARGMAPKGADVVFLDTVGELKMLTVVKGESINQAFAQAARYAKKLGKKNVVVRVMDMTNGIIYDFFPK